MQKSDGGGSCICGVKLTLWGKGNYIFLHKYHCSLAVLTFQIEWDFSSF